jgi:uncharacterized sporulation protein YeaH/YhbH (DUF444 family)
MSKIDSDVGRFKDIVRNRVRKDIGKFIGHDKMIGQQGKKKISIPLDYINVPIFSFGDKDRGGNGMGEGEIGDSVGNNKGKKPGKGKAGEDGTADGSFGPEMSSEDLASLIKEVLSLPNLEPRGTGKVDSERTKYNKIGIIGNESLRHNLKSYKQALKRSISEGTYNEKEPSVIIRKDDKRYKTSTVIDKPEITATCFFIMDDSGSMSEDRKRLVKATSFWIDLLLREHYKNLETVWMVFDTEARVVPREDFFRLSSGGGTRCSAPIQLSKELLETKYTYASTNSYLYMFSDGDSAGDDNRCVELLNEGVLPNCNQFCYGQVAAEGNFIKTMTQNFDNHPKVASAVIENDEGIMPAIQAFFTPK